MSDDGSGLDQDSFFRKIACHSCHCPRVRGHYIYRLVALSFSPSLEQQKLTGALPLRLASLRGYTAVPVGLQQARPGSRAVKPDAPALPPANLVLLGVGGGRAF
eukprot:COSAG02_NODE_6527_length_3518_cov_40.720679_2_plen_104_part_00